MRPSEALAIHGDAIRKIAESNSVRNVRVFGSVLHGTDTTSTSAQLSTSLGNCREFAWTFLRRALRAR